MSRAKSNVSTVYYSTASSQQRGTAVAQWLRFCATNRKVAGSILAGVSGFFIDIKSFRSHYVPWGRLSLQQKRVPGLYPGGKGGRCVRVTTLPSSCAVFIKSGSLKFLEPSGPVEACNVTAFIVTVTYLQNRQGMCSVIYRLPCKLY
jgi:hypothetical protein